MPRSGMFGSYGNSIFIFLRNLRTILHNGCTSLQPLGFRLECLLKEDPSTSGFHLYMVLCSLYVPGRFLTPGVYPCLFLCLKCSFPGCLHGSLSIPSGLSSAITISVTSSLAFLCKNLIHSKHFLFTFCALFCVLSTHHHLFTAYFTSV